MEPTQLGMEVVEEVQFAVTLQIPASRMNVKENPHRLTLLIFLQLQCARSRITLIQRGEKKAEKAN